MIVSRRRSQQRSLVKDGLWNAEQEQHQWSETERQTAREGTMVPTLPVMLPPLPLLLPELPPYGKRHKRHETKQRNNKHARRDER